MKAALIALFGWLSSTECPYAGTSGFKNAISGPIAGGFISGIILGDVSSGVIVGCAVQTIYLSTLVMGGAMSGDMNIVSYTCIPLALVAGADVGFAMALSATLAILGAALFTFYEGFCSIFYAMGDRAIERVDIPAMKRAYILWPAVIHFPIRFGIPFVTVLLGAQYAQSVLDLIPDQALVIGQIVGGMLPAVGMAILLANSLKDIKLMVFYILGVMAVKFTTINIVGVAVLGASLSVLYYMFAPDRPAVGKAPDIPARGNDPG